MNNVFDHMIAEAILEIMEHSIFYSEVLNSYLVIKFFVGWHKPKNIMKYRWERDINLECENVDYCSE